MQGGGKGSEAGEEGEGGIKEKASKRVSRKEMKHSYEKAKRTEMRKEADEERQTERQAEREKEPRHGDRQTCVGDEEMRFEEWIRRQRATVTKIQEDARVRGVTTPKNMRHTTRDPFLQAAGVGERERETKASVLLN